MNNIKLLMAVVAALVISGCGSDATTNLEDSIVDVTPAEVVTAPYAKFDPSNEVLPLPNNLLFAGTTDLTLNIPVADATDFSDPKVAMNALDGFSTVAPMTTTFSTAIDVSSISGSSVKLYEATLYSSQTQPIAGPVVAVSEPLTFGVDYVATLSSLDTSNSTLTIVPLKPLAPSSSYMVVITDDLKTSDGKAFSPSVTYRLFKSLSSPLDCSFPIAADSSNCKIPGALITKLKDIDNATEFNATLASLEGLRQIIYTSNSTVATADATISTSDIILSWSFTTQSIGAILTKEQADISGGDVPTSLLADSGADSPYSAADIYVGTVNVPYYLTAATSTSDSSILGSVWKSTDGADITPLSPDAVPTSTQTIPLMVSIPKNGDGTAGTGQYPVVIYQHGITTNRTTMLAVADAMAQAGMAVVAIDLPLHGLTGNETNGTEAFKTDFERTFDLDLVNNTTGAPGADGVTDPSGKHYINLVNLLNMRDNMRQSVSDLFALTRSLENMAAGAATFDTSKIYFLGHSLGAIIGTTFAALEPGVRDTAFVFGGGGVPKILDGSATFSPAIVAGLGANGVNKGTADYESFVGAAQTVVDTADPVNFTSKLLDKNEGILFFEIVGGSSSPSDLVVPNTVPDGNDSGNTVPSPLSGTEPLLALLGISTPVNTDQGPGTTNLKHSVKFVVGNHRSLLSPAADEVNSAETNLKVTTEIQSITATFLASDGVYLNINEAEAGNLLKAPAP